MNPLKTRKGRELIEAVEDYERSYALGLIDRDTAENSQAAAISTVLMLLVETTGNTSGVNLIGHGVTRYLERCLKV